jgi:hypothetical protein
MQWVHLTLYDDYKLMLYTVFTCTDAIIAIGLDLDLDLGSGDRVPRVEAESNTSTVTLGVVGGDEKGSLTSERVKHGSQS